MIFNCVLIEVLKKELPTMELKDFIALKKEFKIYQKQLKGLEKSILKKEKSFENKDNMKIFESEDSDGRTSKNGTRNNC